MAEAFDVAAHELTLSMTLDAKPLLSYLHAIDISMARGQRDVSKGFLEKSIQIDPRNIIVREKYMGTLQTRWGGSVEEMNAFLEESRAAGLSPARLRTLEILATKDEAWVAQRIEKNTDAAVRSHLKVAELEPNTDCGPCGPLMQAANLLRRDNRHKEAIELYAKILATDPKSIGALTGRGQSELQLGNAQRAVDDFTRAAELGDAWAQDILGRMYLVGTAVPQNRELALQWLQKAADQGYQRAKELLSLTAEKRLESASPPWAPRF